MELKTLLVHAGPDSPTRSRTRLAAGLAHRFGARLIGLSAEAPDPWIDAALPRMTPQMVEELEREEKARRDLARAAFDDATAELDDCVWRSEVGLPARALTQASGAADLVVVGQSGEPGFIPYILPRPGDVVMGTGGPVLVVHPDCDRLAGEVVVVAWKNTREARRAVGDALAFLETARKVVLAAVDEGAGDARESAAEVVRRLEGHGVAVETAFLPASGGAGRALLDLARDAGSDLLVAGAYGHNRAREWAFGGVTQHLLNHAGHCVLFSR
jgi:nucleotide-binding universal stress UspA family protein